MKYKTIAILSVVLFSPLIAFAAPFGGIRSAITEIIGIVGQLRGLVVGLALLYFFWGLAKYIRASGDEKELEAGKRIMIWGVVALFVMTSVAGIIILLQQQVGVSGGGVLQIVQPNGTGSGGSSGGSGSSSGGSSSSGNSSDPFGSYDPTSNSNAPMPPSTESIGGWAPCGPDSLNEVPCRN